jgi:hypothetical protein
MIHGWIPDSNKIQAALEASSEHLESNNKEGKQDKAILKWYFDRLLPLAVGEAYWGKEIRYWNLPTDKVVQPLLGQDPKVLVTITSEAWALFCIDNMGEAWVNQWKLKKEDPGCTIPKGKQSGAEQCSSKYNLSASGRVRYGGVSDEGMRVSKWLNLVCA